MDKVECPDCSGNIHMLEEMKETDNSIHFICDGCGLVIGVSLKEEEEEEYES
jgi:uncharacterized Zn finger protein